MDENNGDKPLSSEEMLRRAREGLGESSSTPPPSSPADDSYSSIESEMDIEMEPIYEDEETPAHPSPEPREYERPAAEPPPLPTPVANDNVGHWAPPRPGSASQDSGNTAPPKTEPESSTWSSQLPSPQPTPKPRKNVGSIVLMIVVVAIGGVLAIKLLDSSKTVDQMAVGECLNFPEKDEFSRFQPIDCTETHELEVFAIIDMATVSKDYSVGTAYPGDNTLFFAALDACSGAPFESYVGVPYGDTGTADTTLGVFAFTPTIEGWRELDERRVQCVVFQQDSSNGQMIPSTRSLEGSGGV
ncbi:MAG: septum formation family protein [Acidimicrobiia bacterium]